MANHFPKKCPSSRASREIQIHKTLRFNLTTVRMAKTYKTTENKYWNIVGKVESLFEPTSMYSSTEPSNILTMLFYCLN